MIETRLTRAFGLDHPIVSAPMAHAGGGRLAAAVSQAGGLGLIGGGYGDADWIGAQLDAAGNASVGVGFITWSMAQAPDVLDRVLERSPRCIFLSFGDPLPFAGTISSAEVPLICQVQTLDHARRAVEAGARAIVAQGREAGGHGDRRATLTLVPEVADYLSAQAPDTLLLAAGGIVDGRGLAAALMLGADGVLCGTRFWASDEALVTDGQKALAMDLGGDGTYLSRVVDVARDRDWPAPYTLRTVPNAYSARWEDRLEDLAQDAAAKALWAEGYASGDTDIAAPIVGEGIGMIRQTGPAADLLAGMTAEAETLLSGGWQR